MSRLNMTLVLLVVVVLGLSISAFGQTKFKVRIENISSAEGLDAMDGTKYPFALSPGLYVTSRNKTDIFRHGRKANPGLEAQAEDGNPELLFKRLQTHVGNLNLGVFSKPVGKDEAAPILPGDAFEFDFTAKKGMKLNLVAMFGQSNDLFYAPEKAIDLFVNGEAIDGDITDKIILWDAGTEVNQAPGIGDEQAPRQKSKNTGKTEKGKVSMVNDGFSYPKITDVLRITITKQ